MMSVPPLPLLVERLARVVQNAAHADGLKPAQWEALRYLARANRFSRTPSAVAAYLGTGKGTASQTLNALERKGLIEKAPDPASRRVVRIEVTGAGRDLLRDDPLDSVLSGAERLPPDRATAASEALQALLESALDARGGRPFGACRSCRHFRRDVLDGAPHRCGLLDVPLSEDDSGRLCVEHEWAA